MGAWVVMPNHVHGLIGITTESPAHDGVTGAAGTERDGSNLPEKSPPTDGVYRSQIRMSSSNESGMATFYGNRFSRNLFTFNVLALHVRERAPIDQGN